MYSPRETRARCSRARRWPRYWHPPRLPPDAQSSLDATTLRVDRPITRRRQPIPSYQPPPGPPPPASSTDPAAPDALTKRRRQEWWLYTGPELAEPNWLEQEPFRSMDPLPNCRAPRRRSQNGEAEGSRGSAQLLPDGRSGVGVHIAGRRKAHDERGACPLWLGLTLLGCSSGGRRCATRDASP
jgi:hypothetical protein